MLEQWRADQLLTVPKVYSATLGVNLRPGVGEDYPVESDDGDDHFLLDVWSSRRNLRKARFQLRYRRDIVLARLCTAKPHGNPDGTDVGSTHLHLYREGDHDKWASEVGPFEDVFAALQFFCKRINLPAPEIQGGFR
jgi:hypothetical protein